MSMLETYRDYFDIDPDYLSAVNEAVINSNPEMWKKFFPHETFVKLLKNTIDVLNRKQKLSVWVEGPYGTGKSHAVLTLKKLLECSEEDTYAYFKRYNLSHDICNSLLNIKDDGKILTVHRYGSSGIHGDNDLVLAIQESIEKAFEQHGIENKAKDSLKNSVIKYLSDPENKQSFNIYVTGSYSDLFGGDDIDNIIQKLRTYSDLALHTLMDKIFRVARERQIRAFTMSTTDLADWIKEVIRANQLRAIVFIWDEFTEYFYNNSRNLTGFQELCEISETDPFYFFIVTHISSALFHEKDKDYIKLKGRFVDPTCTIDLPDNIAFQLMGAAMEKNDDTVVQEDWRNVVDELASRTRDSRKLVKEVAHIQDKELYDILPIHPYTALMLKHISSAFESNQRSMFDFIKNDRGEEIKGFQWFIDNYGPEDENPLLTIDMLWEFFYEKGKEFLAHDIRQVLDYYTRKSNQKLAQDEKRILKTVLLLQAISQHAGDSIELFIPDNKNIDNAFEGTDMDGGAAYRCAEKLVRDKVLYKKQLGSGKFQYNAYVNEVNQAEIDKFKTEIDKRTTTLLITEPLTDETTVADALTLNGALKLRYELCYVSVSDFDTRVRALRNKEDLSSNKIVAVVCFAKDDNESVVIGKRIREIVENNTYHMIFIDATTTPFGADGFIQYRDDMAQSRSYHGNNKELETQYASNAKDALKKWKSRITAGGFIVSSKYNPSGERVATLDRLYEALQKINKLEFPNCLEATYNVNATMYTVSAMKSGVEYGAKEITKQVYSSSNKATKLENALAGAWGISQYWQKSPNLPISKMKIYIDEIIHNAFAEGNRISVRTIYEAFRSRPYGFMPCNLTAFILGFLLKEYADGSYSYSDGLTNEVLTINKLKEIVYEIINLQITPNARYKEKYIVSETEDEKSFKDATSRIFAIPRNLCSSIEQTRERIRSQMKILSFPLWTLEFALNDKSLKSNPNILETLIEYYCGIANSNNLNLSFLKTDNDIALAIGKLCRENPTAIEDLQSLMTKDNCTQGMDTYIHSFENGELIMLAKNVGDNGQYINVLRKKFDADEANWVWNKETVEQKIREVILEYRIINESNQVLSKTLSFDNTVSEWCDKCKYIRISYLAAKNQWEELTPFIEMLYHIKKAGTILDSQKQKFFELLSVHKEKFRNFYNNQIILFKRICDYYLEGLTEEEIKELYQKLPAGTFTYDKQTYMKLVHDKVEEYKNSLGSQKLKTLWLEKTGTTSPREWSKIHCMPILCLIPDKEIQQARETFNAIHTAHPSSNAIEKAIAYLEKATFFSTMADEEKLDDIFCREIIKNYSVVLKDVKNVKNYLSTRVISQPYDWFGLPEIEKKIKSMAEDVYIREGCNKALEVIDEMEISDVKRYLKELVRENMTVGIEIIKEKFGS